MLRCVLPIYFVLTSGHSSCWNADYSHNTISCVSMLTSSSLQSIPLNMKIGFVDLRTSRSFIQSWNNDDSGKRSMSALVAVKWGDPHQSAHSYICFGIAKGIFTIHFGSFPLRNRLIIDSETSSHLLIFVQLLCRRKTNYNKNMSFRQLHWNLKFWRK